MNQQQNLSPSIAIIGLGYVGLPLAVAFSKKYSVIGFDINEQRVTELQNGVDNTLECSSQEIKNASNLQFTYRENDIRSATIFIVTVPTPVDAQKRPYLTALLEATAMIGSILKKDDLVIYESTVYPGCTEEDCVPILEKQSGLIFNKDFFVGYSPERINPGDKVHKLTTIKKLTAGSTPAIADKVDALYASIITAGTFKTSSIKVAEAAKSIENAQRDINISFVNELALIFDKMNIDTHEVLEAAATKWNFLPFQPGLVGGHCIGVDPYYLAHKASSLGYHPQVILSGRNVNDQMSSFVTGKLIELLKAKDLSIKGAKALLLGVSFKENCPDIRNSKAFEIYHQLTDLGMNVDAFDPYASAIEVKKKHSIELVNALGKYDIIVLVVAHDFFKSLDYQSLKASAQTIIYDTKAFLNRAIVTARL